MGFPLFCKYMKLFRGLIRIYSGGRCLLCELGKRKLGNAFGDRLLGLIMREQARL